MEDFTFFSVVAGSQGLEDLAKDGPNHVFRDGLFVPLRIFYESGNVASFTVLHNYKDLGVVSIDYSIIVFDNMGVVELS